jgi:uncharacterized protein (DUF58 family)
VTVGTPGELFAQELGHVDAVVKNRSRFWPRWLVVLAIEADDPRSEGGSSANAKPGNPKPDDAKPRCRSVPWMVGHLAPGAEARAEVGLVLRRRGVWRVGHVQVSSLFPLGLFRKGRRHRLDLELVVYPEIFPRSVVHPRQSGQTGDQAARNAGRGHDLLSLRPYRPGDDPRSIHWKQSARQRELIYQQRTTEESRRLRLVFDNAVGELAGEAEERRFERLVSEAATTALTYLDEGYEVSLVTRNHHLPFAGGPRQRRNVLECLARLDALPFTREQLLPGEPGSDDLRLAMDRPGTPGREPRVVS